jgi:hypothetical protein
VQTVATDSGTETARVLIPVANLLEVTPYIRAKDTSDARDDRVFGVACKERPCEPLDSDRRAWCKVDLREGRGVSD